jgi:hypothetical protein
MALLQGMWSQSTETGEYDIVMTSPPLWAQLGEHRTASANDAFKRYTASLELPRGNAWFSYSN